jgi:uncharacterized integral membrane protein (TIGR00697 family)
MYKANKALPIIAMAYVTAKLVAILLFYKIVTIFSITAAASTLVIPLWFCIGDVITEVYGYKIAKKLVWTSVLCQLFFGWLPAALNYLPTSHITHINQAAYSEVIANLPKGATASFIAIAVGGIVNATVLNKWKLILNGKYFFLRSLGSTAIGELVFTICVYVVGFHGFTSLLIISKLILISFCIKMIVNPLMIAPISILTKFLKKYESDSNKTKFDDNAMFTMVVSDNNNSYFVDQDIKLLPNLALGLRSENFPVKSFVIRNIGEGDFLNWHTVQTPQYAVYLSGEIELEVSKGEKRRFKSGDIVFFNDLIGKGHITKAISPGQALIANY